MTKLDIKKHLYHGIIDWLNYNNGNLREKQCLDKFESILKHRTIYRPCDFKKVGINHKDFANPYTYYFTFVACHPESIYANRFKKEVKDDNGFFVATNYSKFGIILNSNILKELNINEDSFCDNEIVIEDNISIDKYGVGIYINHCSLNEDFYKNIRALIEKYGYKFDIYNIHDGSKVKSKDEEKNKIKKLLNSTK